MRVSSTNIPGNILKCMPKKDRAPLGKAGKTIEELQEEEKFKSEKAFQQACVDLLAQRNITTNRSRMDRKKTDVVGWPDLTFVYRPTGGGLPFACAVECKQPGEAPEPHQADMLQKLELEGWQVSVIYNTGELREFLLKLDRLGEVLSKVRE